MATVNGTQEATADGFQVYGQDDSETIDVSSSGEWYGAITGGDNVGGVRFTLDGAIPQGATITSAIVGYYGYNASNITDAWVHVVDEADPAEWDGIEDRPTWYNSGNSTTYPTTKDGTGGTHWTGTWSLTAWNNITVTSLIQFLVNKYAYDSGDHIIMIISADYTQGNNSENGFSSRNTANGPKPTLTINYTSGVTGSGPHQSTIIQGNW